MDALCRDVRPLLSAYMDNDLTPDELRVVQAHVAACPECAALLAEYRQVRALVRALPQPQPPPALRAAVFARATPAYRRRAFFFDLGQRALSYGALAVAVLAIVVAVTLVARSGVGGPATRDTTAPQIIDWSPQGGVSGWDPGQPIRVTFSEAMDWDSVRVALEITCLRCDAATAAEVRQAARQSLEIDGLTLVIGARGGLRPDTDYQIRIDAAKARDRAGNPLHAGSPIGTLPDEAQIGTAALLVAAATPTPGPSPTAAPPTPVPPTMTPAPTATIPPPSPTIAALAPPPGPSPTATPAPPPTATATTPPPAPTSPPAIPSPTPTPVPPPTATPTATPVPPTPTVAPSPSPSPAPSPTPVVTPTTPPTATPTPVTPTATPALPFAVNGGFGQVYQNTAGVRDRLGLPTENEASVQGAYQAFEHGLMFWRADTRTIYVLFSADAGDWYAFTDTWTDDMDPGGGPAPVAGRYLPPRGFGKVWSEQPDVQKRLGYALTANEASGTLVVQRFERGLLLWSDLGGAPSIYVLYQNNTYERYADPAR